MTYFNTQCESAFAQHTVGTVCDRKYFMHKSAGFYSNLVANGVTVKAPGLHR